jgi:ATP-dependent DNA helicase RecG
MQSNSQRDFPEWIFLGYLCCPERMLPIDLPDVIERLRGLGGDTSPIEVKSALGGLPDTVTQSLCALANQPGGGWLILGLNELEGFSPVGLVETQTLKQGLAAKARACVPPVLMDIHEGKLMGIRLLWLMLVNVVPWLSRVGFVVGLGFGVGTVTMP